MVGLIKWLKRLGTSYRTLLKVNNGQLKITKKGKIKKTTK